jgi:hypothetical protein
VGELTIYRNRSPNHSESRVWPRSHSVLRLGRASACPSWTHPVCYDRALSRRFVQTLARRYFGTSHPSEPNYVAMVGGSETPTRAGRRLSRRSSGPVARRRAGARSPRRNPPSVRLRPGERSRISPLCIHSQRPYRNGCVFVCWDRAAGGRANMREEQWRGHTGGELPQVAGRSRPAACCDTTSAFHRRRTSRHRSHHRSLSSPPAASAGSDRSANASA